MTVTPKMLPLALSLIVSACGGSTAQDTVDDTVDIVANADSLFLAEGFSREDELPTTGSVAYSGNITLGYRSPITDELQDDYFIGDITVTSNFDDNEVRGVASEFFYVDVFSYASEAEGALFLNGSILRPSSSAESPVFTGEMSGTLTRNEFFKHTFDLTVFGSWIGNDYDYMKAIMSGGDSRTAYEVDGSFTAQR